MVVDKSVDDSTMRPEHWVALLSRLMDINFEFIKGTGHWPSLKEISPPNLELIRAAGRDAEVHARQLIEDWQHTVEDRADLLATLERAAAALDYMLRGYSVHPDKLTVIDNAGVEQHWTLSEIHADITSTIRRSTQW